MLQAGILVVGAVFTIASLAADLLYSLLHPRIRLGGNE